MTLPSSTAMALLACLGLALAAWPVTGNPRPERFQVPSVPQMAQVDDSGCGAASLAMVFTHRGPTVDDMQIVDVVRSKLQEMGQERGQRLLPGEVQVVADSAQGDHLPPSGCAPVLHRNMSVRLPGWVRLVAIG